MTFCGRRRGAWRSWRWRRRSSTSLDGFHLGPSTSACHHAQWPDDNPTRSVVRSTSGTSARRHTRLPVPAPRERRRVAGQGATAVGCRSAPTPTFRFHHPRFRDGSQGAEKVRGTNLEARETCSTVAADDSGSRSARWPGVGCGGPGWVRRGSCQHQGCNIPVGTEYQVRSNTSRQLAQGTEHFARALVQTARRRLLVGGALAAHNESTAITRLTPPPHIHHTAAPRREWPPRPPQNPQSVRPFIMRRTLS